MFFPHNGTALLQGLNKEKRFIRVTIFYLVLVYPFALTAMAMRDNDSTTLRDWC